MLIGFYSDAPENSVTIDCKIQLLFSSILASYISVVSINFIIVFIVIFSVINRIIKKIC